MRERERERGKVRAKEDYEKKKGGKVGMCERKKRERTHERKSIKEK